MLPQGSYSGVQLTSLAPTLTIQLSLQIRPAPDSRCALSYSPVLSSAAWPGLWAEHDVAGISAPRSWISLAQNWTPALPFCTADDKHPQLKMYGGLPLHPEPTFICLFG